ncbi:GNAT family N-acetyltransferase [Clostridium botulinum]|uniref:Acetyltransferase n=1 Tax=Clostridium botulinum (strain Hall / ATCC 3502 / NCTC 13319 / Type A) TaxID=441771 RepID=A5HZ89_CLOBH|nr:GNAT family N-acetyltransferase [Clostridium botulinum]EPS49320.1 acetyltransferase [Clostridium botulinum CFSAN002369]EPS50094.1 acetyltransferase [Clostridium botulinum CFSAN002367]ABS34230.1 acetyltransferase, GNAT family [Clostridium botulinum A str. ATCC 19397]ABS37082.1 acetyltransferase, GNAT family [Clostridium botulinum A str. Hall]AWB16469.1 N-acetyltransferase [Clostridium botulinum]
MRNKIIADFAKEVDIDIWMNLVEIVKEDFPGLIIEDYRKILKEGIQQRTALIVKDKTKAIGVLIFSYENKEIAFLAVHPQYRKEGIATALFNKMYNQFPKGTEIAVTTYRENDTKGKAARALYKRLGFIQDELIMEFGYPCQRFIFNDKYKRI